MKLIKAGFWNALSTLIKIVSGFVVNKFVAVWVGPSGMAIMGQFQSFLSMILLTANGGINNGIVKYISEYHYDDKKRQKIISTSFSISLISSLLISFFLIVFNKQLTLFLLKTPIYNSIFIILGLTLVLFSTNTFLISVLNGYQEIKKYTIVNMITSLVSLFLMIILVYFFKVYGILLALATANSLVLFFTLMFVVKSKWFKITNFIQGIDFSSLKKLSKYSLMTLTTAVTIPIAQILVRNYIITNISMDAAGIWQGLLKLSDAYLLVFTTTLTIYFLPKYAELEETPQLKNEMSIGFKFVVPIVVLASTMVYLLRVPLVHILFDKSFLPMTNLFVFEIIGDIFRISTLILSLLIIAKTITRWYILLEIISSLLFVLLSIFFINHAGLIGVTYAYALLYFIAFLLNLCVVKIKIIK